MESNLSFDSKLFFYPVTVVPVEDGRSLVVSTQSANWIVLDNEMELEIFHRLQSGLSVGDAISGIEDGERAMESLQIVLAKVFAREFAGTEKLPVLNLVEGFKMLNLYVTNSCNLRCPHCFMNAGKALADELCAEEIEKILKDFRDNNGEFVTFTGGEPMMRHDFIRLLRFSKELGLKNTVLSNGLLWGDEDIKSAGETIDEIQISIDGVDDQSNSKIRGRGHFRKAVNTAMAFAQRGIKVSIATTFAMEDLHTDIVPEYLKLKAEIEQSANGEVEFKFSKKILPGRGSVPTPEQNLAYMDTIAQIEDAVKPNAKMENFMLGHQPNMVSRNCGIGGLSIRSDGHVFFCNRVHEVDDYGHISSHTMSEWMTIGKRIHESTNVDNVKPCSTCFLRNICNGGCRIDDFANKGRTKHHAAAWARNSCTADNKNALMTKMVKMFDMYYDFSQ